MIVFWSLKLLNFVVIGFNKFEISGNSSLISFLEKIKGILVFFDENFLFKIYGFFS